MKHSHQFIIPLFLILISACTNLVEQENENITKIGPIESESPQIVAIDFENSSYMTENLPEGIVQLSNGVYERKIAPGATGVIQITIDEHQASGDLNGNGQNVGAAILRTNSGGSGTFYELSVVLNQQGQLIQVASMFLGDR